MKQRPARAFAITLAFLCGTAAAAPLVPYESPCECRDNHGKHRWAEKNDQPYRPQTRAKFNLSMPGRQNEQEAHTSRKRRPWRTGTSILLTGSDAEDGQAEVQNRPFTTAAARRATTSPAQARH
jgi:hypothetical protein